MFNKDFYPTPTSVIDRMMQFSDVEGKVILEPSAGSGNIVDWCKSRGAKEVIACETDQRLRSILMGKCNLIGTDFLRVTAEQVSHVDMIVMNPPFSADERHILHAFEIAPQGCEIVALCNSNTVTQYDYYTSRKQLKETIDNYGSYELFGNAFQKAERTTDVCVACIRLFKPKADTSEFDGFFMEEDEETVNTGTGLVKYDFVRDCVARYCEAVNHFDAVMKEANFINDKIKGIGGISVKFGAFAAKDSHISAGSTVTKEQFKKALQKDAWKWLIEKFDLKKYVTSSLNEDINRFVEQQSNVPFTMRNIYRMVEIIVATSGSRMEKTLVDAFDLICSYSAENSTAGEKWKTNSDYMINKRFIVPYLVDSYSWWSGNDAYLRYGNRIGDIEKALCYLTGVNYDTMDSVNDEFDEESQRKTRRRYVFGALYETEFFEVRIYKKGTGHFKFRDDKVWEQFNREVARLKGWALPKNTAQKSKKKTDLATF